MSRREEWRKVLNARVRRPAAMSYEQSLFELPDLQAYEVELSENIDEYVHIMVAGFHLTVDRLLYSDKAAPDNLV